ncbi:glycogen debranching N-terminal domain-containing protein [Rugosimonospora acidiphila]|uniref:Glycogen debranching N-terminal domain-containing protein n=1 Tax=Rugosimonospora acidiphila TaxID=556531 RepID=A0ABP9SLS4_9ACTN
MIRDRTGTARRNGTADGVEATMGVVRDARVRPALLYLASGWSTLVTDVHGRINGVNPQGFFAHNTRLLCRERITVDGREPVSFHTVNVGAHAQLSYVELSDGEKLPSEACYLTIERFLGEGLRTRLALHSWAEGPRQVRVGVQFETDFADTQEAVRGWQQRQVPVRREWSQPSQELRLVYGHPDPDHPDLDRAVAIRVESPVPVEHTGPDSVEAILTVQPNGSTFIDLVAEPVFDGHRMTAPQASYAETHDDAGRARTVLAGEFARLHSSNRDVTTAWATAVDDLATMPLGDQPGPAAPFAGVPFYQQFFGRDTLTISWQSLLAGPTMLRDSLRLNAARIGRRVDDWHDEEPGKLMHEARHGPLSALGLDPLGAYYGDWATPLDFLVFLGQYLAWTGDHATVRELRPTAHGVLDWLSRDADRDGDGFLEYRRRSPGGVKNQGWKDSETAIVDEHGRVVENPIATSELQGYHYAALRHAAVTLAFIGERGRAAGLLARAARLRRRFHPAYWMPDHHSYAQALGPDRRQVRSVSSNDGHLLASGIVPPRYAHALARRLFADDMFSGWGVRTLSADHPAYNPFSYHRGTVWPVDAGTTALGLARYGCVDQLHRLAEATFSAAGLFEGHRLPEAMSGLPRDPAHPHPGVHPQACSPQGWSASAIVAIVQALLALRPVAPLRTILVDPHLPDWLPDLELHGVRVGEATFDLAVLRRRNGRIIVRTRGDRITVIRQPTMQSRLSRRGG